VVPGQQVSGPPSWVAAGTRLTWYGASASVANSRFSWVEDPNGTWTDARTGKRYSRTDEAGPNGEPPQGQPTASGDGIYQIDVVAVEGANVVLESSLYGFHRVDPPLYVHSPIAGVSVAGTYVDGAWVHPAELARLAQTDLGPIAVLRGSYRLNNTTYDAISFVNGLGAGSGGNYVSYTYDLATGILLSANTATAGVRSPFAAPGEGAPTSNTQLTVSRFLGQRQRALPGLGAAVPQWAGTATVLAYQGLYNWVNPVGGADSGAIQLPAQHTVEFAAGGGATWRPFTSRTVSQQAALDARLQNVSGSTGLYWYAPDALARMTQGQVLDQDPITTETVSVSYAGAGQNGQPIVAIDNQAQGFVIRRTYETQTGLLIGYENFMQASGSTLSFQLADRR
jgi:hypothetical protein